MATGKWVALGVLVVSLLFTGVALANGAPSVDWWVIGGGSVSGAAGTISLDGTLGQWVAGSDTADTTHLCSGFWCGAGAQYDVYLPLVLRQG